MLPASGRGDPTGPIFSQSALAVAEEALWLQNQQFSDDGNNLSSLREVESILQTLAASDGDSEAFSALESESDSEQSVQSNYPSSHDTPDDPEDDDSKHTLTPEPTEEFPLVPVERQSADTSKRTPTPPPAEKRKECTPSPLAAEKIKERTPSPPPAEETKDRTRTPPPLVQTFEEYTMSYPYSKYRDDPDAQVHVYAFLQTWEANHVPQRLTEPEAKWSKIAEFGMTLEGPAARWHANHLPGSFATFEALKTKFL